MYPKYCSSPFTPGANTDTRHCKLVQQLLHDAHKATEDSIDCGKILRPTRHKIGNFGDSLPKGTNKKPNIKSNIHKIQNKQTYDKNSIT